MCKSDKRTEDAAYFGRRLTVELDRAREADKMEVKLVHLAMAAGYRAKLHGDERADDTPIIRPTIRA